MVVLWRKALMDTCGLAVLIVPGVNDFWQKRHLISRAEGVDDSQVQEHAPCTTHKSRTETDRNLVRPTGVVNFANEDTRARYSSHMQSPWIILNYTHVTQIDSTAYNSSWNYPPRANWTYYAWSMWSVYSAMSLWLIAWGHETTVETYHEGICGATWPRFEHFGSQLWSLWSWKLVGLTSRGASPLPFFFKADPVKRC